MNKDIKKRDALKKEIKLLEENREIVRGQKNALQVTCNNLEKTIKDNENKKKKTLGKLTLEEVNLQAVLADKTKKEAEIGSKQQEFNKKDKHIKEQTEIANISIVNTMKLEADAKRKQIAANNLLVEAKEVKKQAEATLKEIEKIKEGTKAIGEETKEINEDAQKSLRQIDSDQIASAGITEKAIRIQENWKEKYEEAKKIKENLAQELGGFDKEEKRQKIRGREQEERQTRQDAKDKEQESREAQQNREDGEIEKRRNEVKLLDLRVKKIIHDKGIETELKKLEKALKND